MIDYHTEKNALAVSPVPSDVILTDNVPYLDKDDFLYLKMFAHPAAIPYDYSLPTVMGNFCYITTDALKKLYAKVFFLHEEKKISDMILPENVLLMLYKVFH